MEKGGRVRLDAPRRIGAESAEVDPLLTFGPIESSHSASPSICESSTGGSRSSEAQVLHSKSRYTATFTASMRRNYKPFER
jgi:hypothetical protein